MNYHIDEPLPCVATLPREAEEKASFHSEVQWTNDGSFLVARSNAWLYAYLCPEDLIVVDDEPTDKDKIHLLRPNYQIYRPSTKSYFSSYPGFDSYDAATTYVLSTNGTSPIQLHNLSIPVGDAPYPHGTNISLTASYPLDRLEPTTRDQPRSLAFISGSNFAVGHDNRYCIYDVNRARSAPIWTIQTAQRFTSRPGPVSALSISPAAWDGRNSGDGNVLAVGSLGRWVGLWDGRDLSRSVADVNLKDLETRKIFDGSFGVTGIDWTPCGTYLYVAERNSNSICVLDVRDLSRPVAVCVDRNARGSTPMGIEVYQEDDAVCVVGGGADGRVRSWRGAHLSTGNVQPCMDVQLHQGPVGSAACGWGGWLMATCSDIQYGEGYVYPYSSTLVEKSLKIWAL